MATVGGKGLSQIMRAFSNCLASGTAKTLGALGIMEAKSADVRRLISVRRIEPSSFLYPLFASSRFGFAGRTVDSRLLLVLFSASCMVRIGRLYAVSSWEPWVPIIIWALLANY